MKKLLPFCICLITYLTAFNAKAQVWFPEGEFFNLPEPAAFTIENPIIFTISKYKEDTAKNQSIWVVAKYDGKGWTNFPYPLTLNRGAEVTNIRYFDGSLYVSGNFLYDGLYPSLVRFNIKTLIWSGVAKFRQNSQLPIVISALEVFNKKLIIGGNFNTIVAAKDSLPYLLAYNGADFSSVFNNCKNCFPSGKITDLAANDTVLAIAGIFTQIKNRKSNFLFLHHLNEDFDTFTSTKIIVEKLAINDATTVFGAGTVGKEKKIYKMDPSVVPVDMGFNLDSITRINKMLVADSGLWVNGIAYIKGANLTKITTMRLSNLKWTDYTSNYPGAKSITFGRGSLWAIGNADKPLSIWNNNKFLMRFYRFHALAKVKVFLDSNNNCIQEKNERPLGKQLIKLTLLNDRYAITNEHGLAEFLFLNAPSGVPFKISLPRNFKPSNCGYETVIKSFKDRYFDSLSFSINRKYNINDVKVIISAPKGSQVMKDKRMDYSISVENVGSNIVSGILTLKKNSFLSSEHTEPAGKLSPASVEWSYANLNPGEKRTYQYSGVASDTHFVDNTPLNAQASASISSVQNDYPDDDTDSLQQFVDNTNNPFRKDIYPIPNPGDSISYLAMTDRQIRYHINFNNYSSSIVYNATITDTLDLNLDMSYIEETGSNKSYYTEIETDPNNSYRGIIIWHFQGINLTANPSKNFEITTSGSYIGFKVVMKPLSNGYIVKNTAAVFYDNQYAGKTNTAYCTVLNTGIDEVRTDLHSLLVYPNPASSQLQLNLPLGNNDKILVYNAQGQQVQITLINENTETTTLDIEALNSGVYMVQILKGNQLFYSKFIKL